MKTRDPKTPAEWQVAVDAAYACLSIDAAHQYGLITGGPRVHVDRADELLHRGAAMGIKPSPDALEKFLDEWLSAHPGRQGA